MWCSNLYTCSSHISNVDDIKVRRCISILMVPLDSLWKYLSLAIFVKVLSFVYTTSCRFFKVVDLQARWIGLGAAGILRSAIPQNRIHQIHTTSISNALQYSMKKPCACAYFNFEMISNFKNAGSTRKIHLRDSAIHFAWKSTTS